MSAGDYLSICGIKVQGERKGSEDDNAQLAGDSVISTGTHHCLKVNYPSMPLIKRQLLSKHTHAPPNSTSETYPEEEKACERLRPFGVQQSQCWKRILKKNIMDSCNSALVTPG